MNRKLLAAVVSGTLAVPMSAQVQADEMAAHSHDVYGSLRYGVVMEDDGKSNTNSKWDIGGNSASRFGIKGSSEVGEGLTAGFKLERNLNEDLSARHHHVYLSSGSFGTVTLGQQGSPYYGASTWDGASHLGGVTDVGSRVQGVSYDSSLGGPFKFSVLAGNGEEMRGADNLEVGGHLNAGPVSLSAGYKQLDDGTRLGGTAKGSAGNITLHLGYETATDLCPEGTVCPTGDQYDSDRFGFNLSYLLAAGPGGGNAFVQYANRDDDRSNGEGDLDHWVFGYSYYASKAVTIDLAHRIKNETTSEELTDTASVVIVKVDF